VNIMNIFGIWHVIVM